MTDHNTPLNEQELLELDEFLVSEQVPEECMDISMLDGFLTALIIAPRPLLPEVWLPWVWDSENGRRPPTFQSAEHQQHLMDLFIRHMNSIGHTLLHNPDEYAPLVYESEDTYADGEPVLAGDAWCIGFMRGVELGEADWLPCLEAHGDLLVPIALLGTEDGMDILQKMSEDEQRMAVESLAPTVLEIYESLRQAKPV